MNYKVETSEHFDSAIKRLSKKYFSIRDDLESLVKRLNQQPESGISLGGGVFKIKLKVKSKSQGKSGGARVITYVYYKKETVYLIDIYDKGEMETVKIESLKLLVKQLNLKK